MRISDWSSDVCSSDLEDGDAVGDQIDAVVGAAACLILVLADATDDVNKVALAGGQTLGELVEQRDTVPVGIGLPVDVFLAVVVRGNRKISELFLPLDLAYSADDSKLFDFLIGSISVLDCSICRNSDMQ